MTELTCTIGIMAHNEEGNIGNVLDALLRQRLDICRIKEIIVVSSGSTDKTNDIVKEYSQKYEKVKLSIQLNREGKASAINQFLKLSTTEIIIMESADTIPAEDCIENIVRPFQDPNIGMTGGHPIPVNDPNTLTGFIVHLMWRLHHRIACEQPKLGEIVALRNIVREIPGDTAVDEANLETIVQEKGYKLHYARDAIVNMKGPETIRDFIKRRRSIAAGHIYLKRKYHYTVSTWNVVKIIRFLLKETKFTTKHLSWTLIMILLECWGRLLGLFDYYIIKKNSYIWDIAETTKNNILK